MGAQVSTYTIAVADFDHIYRSSLIGTLCTTLDRKVLFCSSNGRELIEQQQQHPADLIIVELFLPVITGFEAIKILKKAHTSGKILAVSATYQPEMVKPLMEMGVDGYCSKDINAVDNSVKQILEGNKLFDTSYFLRWSQETEKYILQSKKTALDSVDLRPVDIKIMELTCNGKSNKEIGELLNLSKRTIDTYVRDLLIKLNLNTKIELVNFAMHNGLCRLTCNNSEAGFCTCKTLFV